MNLLRAPARAALRTAVAVLVGLVAVVAFATPAHAAPGDYFATDIGEDGCTVFDTTGNAVVYMPGMPVIELVGRADRYVEPGEPGHCLDVEPLERHLLFIAWDSGTAIGELHVPMPSEDGSEEYRETLIGYPESQVSYMTVAVCVTGAEPDWEHCGDWVVFVPDYA